MSFFAPLPIRQKALGTRLRVSEKKVPLFENSPSFCHMANLQISFLDKETKDQVTVLDVADTLICVCINSFSSF